MFHKIHQSYGLKTFLSFLSIILVAVSLSVLCIVSFRTSVSTILERTESMDQSNLRQVNNKIDFSMGEIEKLTRTFSVNQTLIEKLTEYSAEGNKSFYDKNKIDKKVWDIFNKMQVGYEDILRIEVYTDLVGIRSDRFPTSLNAGSIRNSSIYTTIKNSERSVSIFGPNLQGSIFEKELGGFVFGSLILQGDKELGYIFVVMKPQWMDQVFIEENNVIISSKLNQKVIWSSSNNPQLDYTPILKTAAYEQGKFKGKMGNNDYQFFYMKNKYGDWQILTFRSLENTYQTIKKVRNNVLITALISSFISIVCGIYISNRIARPILYLRNKALQYNAQDNSNHLVAVKESMGIKKVFMIYFALVATVPMIIYSITFYYSSSTLIENKVKESILLTFKQTANNIDSFIAINERISTNIMVNPAIQNYLVRSMRADYKPGDEMEQIGGTIEENLSLAENIFETALYNTEKKPLFSTSFFINKEPLQIDEYNLSTPLWLSYDLDKYNRNVIRLIRKIRGVKSDDLFLKGLGYLQTTYYETNIESIYRDVQFANNNTFIIDENGTIISHNSKSRIGQKSQYSFDRGSMPISGTINISNDPNHSLLIYVFPTKIPWILVGELDEKVFREDSLKMLTINMYTVLFMILIVLIFSHVFAKGLANSIIKLKKKLIIFSDGYIHADFSTSSKVSEIQELGMAFNNMAQRIRNLIETVYLSNLKEKELEHEKKEAELIALQAQINPHFLSNTMESIKWMIKGDKKEKAAEMITALGSLFRIGISQQNKLVTIEEELDYARAYIDIQKVRLGDKVKFSWSVDQSLLQYYTPKLILQPIIENAIMHGISKKDELKGNISITCYSEELFIIFKISDDGIGIETRQLESMNKENSDHLGIGINNVRKRIKLYFGGESRVVIESMSQMGTIVKIMIPKVTKDEI
ncbi:sensor histidine kinase [Paenibacillus eucommiae]|uniref:histidine kinase n=1 Tax=Paenibacillus eucommiae TaxID=1355755 RepID=A0ABS4ITC3_9BACL|nr:sensor histidine kinase [Paenibacillus eucommiae]MBP1990817.1 sensor histidine kinase YesM [Paenibacillus eucommiae]